MVSAVKDTWKEMKMRAEGEEEELLIGKPIVPKPQTMGNKSSKSSSRAPAREEEGDGIMESGFNLRDVTPQAIRMWVGFQVLALIFQYSLWREASSHLAEFEDVIARECTPQHLKHGVCVGPMWNMSTWQDKILGSAESHSFTFRSTSNPPTFLLVVDPISQVRTGSKDDPAAAPIQLANQGEDLKSARWSIEVVRTRPAQVSPPMKQYRAGQEAISFEDLSTEALDMVKTQGSTEWRATISVRGRTRQRTRYVAFVEDAVATRLGDGSTRGPHCAFGKSWKAFNQHHQGTSHQKLSWASWLLGIFFFIGGAMVYKVHEEVTKKSSMGHKFHAVVIAKFALLDLPQQVCIVLYILGWYEASGLRCQLCMFHPQHCSEEHVFSFSNTIAFTCCMMSSVSNQLLLRPVVKRSYTEDDICLQWCVRVGGICLSILPFTTGLCVASSSILPVPAAMHIFAAVPLGIGYLTLAGLTCVPILACCDEDCGDL